MNEEYYRGRYDEMQNYKDILVKELNKWKIAFGWALAGLIIGLFIAILK
jgi:hypothetical protein